MRVLQILTLCVVTLITNVTARAQNTSEKSDAGAKAEIRHMLDTYMQAVDAADPSIAAKVFLTSPDVSFINPVGHERGWDQIADEVFVKLMGQTFSRRSLTASTEPVIHIYGDAAVLEFDWNFVAALRKDGSPVHTTGRESQFYVRFPDKGWRLVHVHYSGPPVTPPSNGRF
jgi:ketosteroid isomerase-like protein